ncbi:MAG: hypothetical protein WAP35_00335 [Solirubrobacterales bacterium]
MLFQSGSFPRANVVRISLFAMFSVVLLAFASIANAAKPPKQNSALSISATPKAVTYGQSVVIKGKLKVASGMNQPVQLQANAFPYTAFVGLTIVNTDAAGNYSMTVIPRLNTRYRVQSTTATPQQTSIELSVPVAPRISLRLSDRTPKSGQRVKFSGYVWPAHDGRLARIQRRSTTGAWRTLTRVRLADFSDTRSKYTKYLRIRSDGTYRVQLLADPDHATGLSATRTARVH